jgi:hypothetical protein
MRYAVRVERVTDAAGVIGLAATLYESTAYAYSPPSEDAAVLYPASARGGRSTHAAWDIRTWRPERCALHRADGAEDAPRSSVPVISDRAQMLGRGFPQSRHLATVCYARVNCVAAAAAAGIGVR